MFKYDISIDLGGNERKQHEIRAEIISIKEASHSKYGL
jgi:hypothetical protein